MTIKTKPIDEAALLALMMDILVKARNDCTTTGLDAEQAKRLNALLDASHNIPFALHSPEQVDEQWLSQELSIYDRNEPQEHERLWARYLRYKLVPGSCWTKQSKTARPDSIK